jgi:hypothetical protein
MENNIYQPLQTCAISPKYNFTHQNKIIITNLLQENNIFIVILEQVFTCFKYFWTCFYLKVRYSWSTIRKSSRLPPSEKSHLRKGARSSGWFANGSKTVLRYQPVVYIEREKLNIPQHAKILIFTHMLR